MKTYQVKVVEQIDHPPAKGKEFNLMLDDGDLPLHVYSIKSLVQHVIATLPAMEDGETIELKITRKDMTPAELDAIPVQ